MGAGGARLSFVALYIFESARVLDKNISVIESERYIHTQHTKKSDQKESAVDSNNDDNLPRRQGIRL